jgi:ribonuclease P protein component
LQTHSKIITIKSTFNKQERLCSKKQMEVLFNKGRGANVYPIKSVYIESSEESDFPVRVMFVVPKRNFKKAWQRNKLKRRMREVYRLNKHTLYSKLQTENKKIILALIYTGKKTEEYKEIEKAMLKLMGNL